MGTSEPSVRATEPWNEGPLFGRDPAHEALVRQIIPRLLEGREAPLRAWLIGCRSGEEAYALAIELLVAMGDAPLPFRVFATDVDQERIAFARAGRYPSSALANVSEARRRAYFRDHHEQYRVAELVRHACVFAKLDLLCDPPLGRMDLVVCRGVPSAPGARGRVLASLHYALRPQGYLISDPSEALTKEAFTPLPDTPGVFARGAPLRLVSSEPEPLAMFRPGSLDPTRQLERMLTEHFAPPTLLLDDSLTVLQTRGDIARVFGAQAATHADLREVVGPNLAGPLGVLARQALRTTGTGCAGTISSVHAEVDFEWFDVWALPLTGPFERRCVALAFVPQREVALSPLRTLHASEVLELRAHVAEIAAAHARTSEQLVSLNDALAATNEELSISNEDLQSLNEELRTAQEQLLSSNDELNDAVMQIAQRNTELVQLHSDLVNVFTTAGIPVMILDAAARIRRFSNQAQQLANVRDCDVGRAFDDLRLNIDMPDLGACVANVLALGVAEEREVRACDGRWHRVDVRPYRGPDASIDGVVISLHDIDALKQAARQAELASQQAERANRAKDEFLATLSHELRSPLHGVMVYAQLLRRDALRGEKVQQAVDAIEDGVSLLVQLLDELLDVSRIVSGKFTLRKQPTDLVELVTRALEAVAEECADKQLRVRAELPDTLRLTGDGLRLQQVVANLLSNAIKFTPTGGAIVVSLQEAGAHARLCVRDDGVGIEADFLPRVFERFTQGDSTLVREYGGLGLGLHIVRQIVALHGGEVLAESAGPGQGALFTVSLPATLELEAEALPPDVPVATRVLDGLRILVVDDDRVARTAVSEVLSHAGAEVLSAPSAADALEAVVECEPQLLLCDIAMPGEDGYALIKRVRALEDPTRARIPALALTAFASASDRERALAAGYQDHLAKPVDVERLMQALSTLHSSAQ